MDSPTDTPAICWLRFTVAVEALRRGDDGPAHTLVERVRAKAGNFAAATAWRELCAYAGLDVEET